MNIAHGHLSAGRLHPEGCAERCVPGCAVLALEEWLSRPVTKADQLADERQEQRLQALMRGEIPQ